MALSERDLRDVHEGTLRSKFKDRYWQSYQDVWNFHREFYGTAMRHEDYWKVVERTMQETREAHNNVPLVCELLDVVYRELERVWNERAEINAIHGTKRHAIMVFDTMDHLCSK